jgi:hypothetical protein
LPVTTVVPTASVGTGFAAVFVTLTFGVPVTVTSPVTVVVPCACVGTGFAAVLFTVTVVEFPAFAWFSGTIDPIKPSAATLASRRTDLPNVFMASPFFELGELRRPRGIDVGPAKKVAELGLRSLLR